MPRRGGRRRWIIPLVLLLLGIGAGLAAMVWLSSADPIVRTAYVPVPDWPAGTPPVRVVALTDLHIAGPDSTIDKLRRVVATVNRLRPDIVVITGDFLSAKWFATRHWPPGKAVAPLAALTARLGTLAVLGNHDHEDGAPAIERALAAAHVRVLDNRAVRRGPLLVVGLDDPVTDHENLFRAFRRAPALGGVPVVLAHSPEVLPWIPRGVRLFLAGHTHCGQVSLPLIGPVTGRYAAPVSCGLGHVGPITAIVGAGLGTSHLPVRLGAPPDLWLVTLGPTLPARTAAPISPATNGS